MNNQIITKKAKSSLPSFRGKAVIVDPIKYWQAPEKYATKLKINCVHFNKLVFELINPKTNTYQAKCAGSCAWCPGSGETATVGDDTSREVNLLVEMVHEK